MPPAKAGQWAAPNRESGETDASRPFAHPVRTRLRTGSSPIEDRLRAQGGASANVSGYDGGPGLEDAPGVPDSPGQAHRVVTPLEALIVTPRNPQPSPLARLVLSADNTESMAASRILEPLTSAPAAALGDAIENGSFTRSPRARTAPTSLVQSPKKLMSMPMPHHHVRLSPTKHKRRTSTRNPWPINTALRTTELPEVEVPPRSEDPLSDTADISARQILANARSSLLGYGRGTSAEVGELPVEAVPLFSGPAFVAPGSFDAVSLAGALTLSYLI